MKDKEFLEYRERTVLTYGFLFSAAKSSLYQAENTEEGRFYNCMSAGILLAFCFEAFFNHVNNILVPYWDEDIQKNLNIKNKLKIICHYLNIEIDYSKRPYQTYNEIIKFRNTMAHAQTENICDKDFVCANDDNTSERLETKWEKQCNIETIKRWSQDTKTIIKQIIEVANNKEILPPEFISTSNFVRDISNEK